MGGDLINRINRFCASSASWSSIRNLLFVSLSRVGNGKWHDQKASAYWKILKSRNQTFVSWMLCIKVHSESSSPYRENVLIVLVQKKYTISWWYKGQSLHKPQAVNIHGWMYDDPERIATITKRSKKIESKNWSTPIENWYPYPRLDVGRPSRDCAKEIKKFKKSRC